MRRHGLGDAEGIEIGRCATRGTGAAKRGGHHAGLHHGSHILGLELLRLLHQFGDLHGLRAEAVGAGGAQTRDLGQIGRRDQAGLLHADAAQAELLAERLHHAVQRGNAGAIGRQLGVHAILGQIARGQLGLVGDRLGDLLHALGGQAIQLGVQHLLAEVVEVRIRVASRRAVGGRVLQEGLAKRHAGHAGVVRQRRAHGAGGNGEPFHREAVGLAVSESVAALAGLHGGEFLQHGLHAIGRGGRIVLRKRLRSGEHHQVGGHAGHGLGRLHFKAHIAQACCAVGDAEQSRHALQLGKRLEHGLRLQATGGAESWQRLLGLDAVAHARQHALSIADAAHQAGLTRFAHKQIPQTRIALATELRQNGHAHRIEHLHLALQLLQLSHGHGLAIAQRGPGRVGGTAAARELRDRARHQPGQQQDRAKTGEQELVVLAEKLEHGDSGGLG